jgi:hypothetical protein
MSRREQPFRKVVTPKARRKQMEETEVEELWKD